VSKNKAGGAFQNIENVDVFVAERATLEIR